VFEFRSGLVDLVVGARHHRGGGHRLTLAGERFLGLVADYKLHELRRTAASLAIRSGTNIKALQNILGHASAGLTLDRYGHLYDSDLDLRPGPASRNGFA
jgi:integrase